MAGFCTNCGSPLEAATKFCAQCGTQVEGAKSAQSQTSVAPQQPAPVYKSGSHGFLWGTLAAVAVILVTVSFVFLRSHGSPSGQTIDAESRTVIVPGNQAWTTTGVFLDQGTVLKITASGDVSMGAGWPPMPPEGRPPDCGGRAGFPAANLPCWSLIGRVGEHGAMFYVGNGTTFQAPVAGQLYLGVNDNVLEDNSGNWTATVTPLTGLTSPISIPSPGSRPASTQPVVIKAIIEEGKTSLRLPGGQMYIYGMATGGAAPSSEFEVGESADVADAAGKLAAALAYGASAENTYTTQTGYHVIGGVSVGGSWDKFNFFSGANRESGASSASAKFTVIKSSLVVVIGLAAGQQSISLGGVPSLQIDVSNSGPSASEGMIIAHAYLEPGEYTVLEQSAALSAGQDPNHMADLVGVFVFGFRP